MRRSILCLVKGICAISLLPSHALPQDRSAGFTVWTNISTASWASGLKKRALIIGNGTYDPNGDGDQKPPPRPLHNLPNPCGDARLVASSLIEAGWATDEIAVACDQGSADIATALQALYDSLPSDPRADQITFIYLSGHGMQIGSNDYFFGKNALPDFDEAASRLEYNPGVRVFTKQTLDPIGFFTSVFGGNRTRRAIWLVIDACRNDPLFENIRQSLLNKAKSLDPAAQEQVNQTVRSITAPAGGGIDFPTGMRVLFGSTVGHVVDDDDGVDGHSRLSSALAKEIALGQSRTADAIISSTLDDVEDSVRGMTDERLKHAQALGGLEGDPCFSRCARQTAASVPKRARQSRLILAAYHSEPQQDTTPLATPPNADAVANAEPNSPQASTSGFEAFWCSTGSEEDAARRLNAENAAKIVRREQSIGTLPATTVRVTELPADENAKPGYQISDDSLLFDPRNSTTGEQIHGALPTLQSIAVKGNATNYISAYYCKGAYTGPISATVYLQVPDSSLLNYSSLILDQLRKKFPNLYIQPRTDVRDNSPDSTELRFFDRRKTPSVRQVGVTLTSLTGVPVRRRLFSSLASTKSINQYEIWIGKKDIEAVKAKLLNSSSP